MKIKGDYWILHPIQMEQLLECFPITEISNVPSPTQGSTYMGLSIIQDANFPKDMAELRDKDHRILLQIKNLVAIENG